MQRNNAPQSAVSNFALALTDEVQQLRQVATSPLASTTARYCAEQALTYLFKQNNPGDSTTGQAVIVLTRKVSGSGHISYRNRQYFVSRRLAGQRVQIHVEANLLRITGSFTLHKELFLS